MAPPSTSNLKMGTALQALKKAFSSGDNDVTSTGLLLDVQKLGFRDYETMLAFFNAAVTGVQDDDELLLENTIQLLAKLPPHSAHGKQLTDGLITALIHHPRLGAANTAYARATAPLLVQPPNQPDPGLIFDTLMARGDTFRPHPQGISSMFFYLATIIIHDLFQTSTTDYSINLTSSYADLAPLYGRNAEELTRMRTFEHGLLKPDCFSSKRILGFPPGCGVLLVMFNRFHNYIVTELSRINENDRFHKPSSDADAAAWQKYDEDLFQTGRLITCGLYGNIVLHDYARTILGLNRVDSPWNLDPRSKAGKNILSQPSPQGVGNHVTVEFNLLYRWHSIISERDEKWTIETFQELLGGHDPSTASLGDMVQAFDKFMSSLAPEPEKRSLGKVQRNEDGTFNDDDLVSIFQESVEDVAGSFGANTVPKCLRAIEMLGILQSRYWKVATLNEFRQYFGLTKHPTFEDINPDPEVAKKLRQLYDTPDSVELYTGLITEKTKKPMNPGSGLCVNFTRSRAILSDAISLIRGDRFYTLDFNPKNITNWGFNEVSSNSAVDQSHLMYKLVFRAFPQHFVQNSIYAHYPFVLPSENKAVFDGLGTSSKYSWEAPQRTSAPVLIRSPGAIKKILDDQTDFKVIWGPGISAVVDPTGTSYSHNFALSGDKEGNVANRKHMIQCFYPQNWDVEFRDFSEANTRELLGKHSFPVAGAAGITREVDVVRDVFSLATAKLVAAVFSLPLKTDDNPHGKYSEQELYAALLAVLSSTFHIDIATTFSVQEISRPRAQNLGQSILHHAKVVAKVCSLVDTVAKAEKKLSGSSTGGATHPGLPHFGNQMILRLLKAGKSAEETVWGSILPFAAGGAANQTRLITQCLDYYLGEGKEHLPELFRLAHLDAPEANELLMKYMLEGSRLRHTVATFRVAASDQVIDDFGHVYAVPAGTLVLCDFTAVSRDPAAFPDPETVKLDRPLDDYIHYGWGPHQCLGKQASRAILTAMFKTVVGLEGLRRADGPRGELKTVPVHLWGGQVGRGSGEVGAGLKMYMTADQSSYWPVPTTMRIRWEE